MYLSLLNPVTTQKFPAEETWWPSLLVEMEIVKKCPCTQKTLNGHNSVIKPQIGKITKFGDHLTSKLSPGTSLGPEDHRNRPRLGPSLDQKYRIWISNHCTKFQLSTKIVWIRQKKDHQGDGGRLWRFWLSKGHTDPASLGLSCTKFIRFWAQILKFPLLICFNFEPEREDLKS